MDNNKSKKAFALIFAIIMMLQVFIEPVCAIENTKEYKTEKLNIDSDKNNSKNSFDSRSLLDDSEKKDKSETIIIDDNNKVSDNIPKDNSNTTDKDFSDNQNISDNEGILNNKDIPKDEDTSNNNHIESNKNENNDFLNPNDKDEELEEVLNGVEVDPELLEMSKDLRAGESKILNYPKVEYKEGDYIDLNGLKILTLDFDSIPKIWTIGDLMRSDARITPSETSALEKSKNKDQSIVIEVPNADPVQIPIIVKSNGETDEELTEEQLLFAEGLNPGEAKVFKEPKTEYKSFEKIDLDGIEIIAKTADGEIKLITRDKIREREDIKVTPSEESLAPSNYYEKLKDQEFLKDESENLKLAIDKYIEDNGIENIKQEITIEIPNFENIVIPINVEDEGIGLTPLELYNALKMEKSSMKVLNIDRMTYRKDEDLDISNIKLLLKDESGALRIVTSDDIEKDYDFEVDSYDFKLEKNKLNEKFETNLDRSIEREENIVEKIDEINSDDTLLKNLLKENIDKSKNKKSEFEEPKQTYITIEYKDYKKLNIPMTIVSEDAEITKLEDNENLDLSHWGLVIDKNKTIFTVTVDAKNLSKVKETELNFLNIDRSENKDIKVDRVVKTNGVDEEDITLTDPIYRINENLDEYRNLPLDELTQKLRDFPILKPLNLSNKLEVGYKYVFFIEVNTPSSDNEKTNGEVEKTIETETDDNSVNLAENTEKAILESEVEDRNFKNLLTEDETKESTEVSNLETSSDNNEKVEIVKELPKLLIDVKTRIEGAEYQEDIITKEIILEAMDPSGLLANNVFQKVEDGAAGLTTYPYSLPYESHQKYENGYMNWDITIDTSELKEKSGSLTYNNLGLSLYAPKGQGLSDYKVTIDELNVSGTLNSWNELYLYNRTISKANLPNTITIHVKAKVDVPANTYTVGVRLTPDANYIQKLGEELLKKAQEGSFTGPFAIIIEYVKNLGTLDKFKKGFNLIDVRLPSSPAELNSYDEFRASSYGDTTRTMFGTFDGEDNSGTQKIDFTISDTLRLEEINDSNIIKILGDDVYNKTFENTNTTNTNPDVEIYTPNVSGTYTRQKTGDKVTKETFKSWINDLNNRDLLVPGTVINYTWHTQPVGSANDSKIKVDFIKRTHVDGTGTTGGVQYASFRKRSAEEMGRGYHIGWQTTPYSFGTGYQALPSRNAVMRVVENYDLVWCINWGKKFPADKLFWTNEKDYYIDKVEINSPQDLKPYLPADNPVINNPAQLEDIYVKLKQGFYFADKYQRQLGVFKANDIKAYNGMMTDYIGELTSTKIVYNQQKESFSLDGDDLYKSQRLRETRDANLNEWTDEIANSVKLTVYANSKGGSGGYQNVITGDIIDPIEITKVDENGAPLQGAEFKLTGSNNTNITWSSTDEADKKVYLEPGWYTLEETKAPEGRDPINPYSFSISDKKSEDSVENNDIPLLKDNDYTSLNNTFQNAPIVENHEKVYYRDINKVFEAKSGGQFVGGNYIDYVRRVTGSNTDKVEITEGGLKIKVTNPEDKLGEVILKKVTEDGTILENAEFTLSGTTLEGQNYSRTVASGKNGMVEFKDLPPGNYTIKETKAPDGYRPLIYEFNVEVKENGTTTVTEKKDDIGTGNPGDSQGTVKVNSYRLEGDNSANGTSVRPDDYEGITLKANISTEDIKKGDSFEIKLDEKLQPSLITNAKSYNPPAIKRDNKVIALGYYDASSNTITYQFTDYVEENENPTFDLVIEGIGANRDKVTSSGNQSFTNTIGEFSQDTDLNIQYETVKVANNSWPEYMMYKSSVSEYDKETGKIKYTIYLNPEINRRGPDRNTRLSIVDRGSNSLNITNSNIRIYKVTGDKKAIMVDSMKPNLTSAETVSKDIKQDLNNNKMSFDLPRIDFNNNESNPRFNGNGYIIVAEVPVVDPTKDINIGFDWESYDDYGSISNSYTKVNKSKTFNLTKYTTASQEPHIDRIIPNPKTVEGQVTLKKTDENGKPLRGAEFTLTGKDVDGNDVTIVASSEADGLVKFTNIPQGTYRIKETKAPEGYELIHYDYEVTINEYGVASIREVPKLEDAKNKNPKKTIFKAIRNAVKSPKITVDKYELYGSNRDNGETVYAGEAEPITMKVQMKLTDVSAKKGDTFEIDLDEKLQPRGLVPTIGNTPNNYYPPAIKNGNDVIAFGSYDKATNKITYTFTDYVEKHTHVNMFLEINGMGPNRNIAIDSKSYDFTNVIGGFSETKNLNIDYRYSNSTTKKENYIAHGNYPNYMNSMGFTPEWDKDIGSIKQVTYLNLANTRGPDKNTRLTYIDLGQDKNLDIENSQITIYKVPARLKTGVKDQTNYDSLKLKGNSVLPESMSPNLNGLQKISKPIHKTENGEIYIDFSPQDFAYAGFIIINDIPIDPQSIEAKIGINWRTIVNGVESTGDAKIDRTNYVRMNYDAAGGTGTFIDKVVPNIKDTKGKFEIKKTDKEAKALAGATFTLTKDGKEVAKGTSDENGKISFEKLEPGEYELKETNAPTGYAPIKTTWKVTVAEDGTTTITENNPSEDGNSSVTDDKHPTLTVKNEKSENKGKFTITKKAEGENGGEGDLLPGATFELRQGDKVIAKGTSDEQGNITFENLEPGTYTLVETKAPEGYEPTKDTWTVTVDANGVTKVTSNNNTKALSEPELANFSNNLMSLYGLRPRIFNPTILNEPDTKIDENSWLNDATVGKSKVTTKVTYNDASKEYTYSLDITAGPDEGGVGIKPKDIVVIMPSTTSYYTQSSNMGFDNFRKAVIDWLTPVKGNDSYKVSLITYAGSNAKQEIGLSSVDDFITKINNFSKVNTNPNGTGVTNAFKNAATVLNGGSASDKLIVHATTASPSTTNLTNAIKGINTSGKALTINQINLGFTNISGNYNTAFINAKNVNKIINNSFRPNDQYPPAQSVFRNVLEDLPNSTPDIKNAALDISFNNNFNFVTGSTSTRKANPKPDDGGRWHSGYSNGKITLKDGELSLQAGQTAHLEFRVKADDNATKDTLIPLINEIKFTPRNGADQLTIKSPQVAVYDKKTITINNAHKGQIVSGDIIRADLVRSVNGGTEQEVGTISLSLTGSTTTDPLRVKDDNGNTYTYKIKNIGSSDQKIIVDTTEATISNNLATIESHYDNNQKTITIKNSHEGSNSGTITATLRRSTGKTRAIDPGFSRDLEIPINNSIDVNVEDHNENGDTYTYFLESIGTPKDVAFITTESNDNSITIKTRDFKGFSVGVNWNGLKPVGTITVNLSNGESVTLNAENGYSYEKAEEGITVTSVQGSEGYTYTYSGADGKYTINVSKDAEVPNITVVNKKAAQGHFQIKKTNEDGSKLLPGAEFTLKKADDSWNLIDGEEPITVTTEDDGIAKFENLPPGNYVLTESKAPTGYEESNKTWRINIDKDGKVIVKEYIPGTSETTITETLNNSANTKLYQYKYGTYTYNVVYFWQTIEKLGDGSYKVLVNYNKQYGNNYSKSLVIKFNTDNFEVTGNNVVNGEYNQNFNANKNISPQVGSLQFNVKLKSDEFNGESRTLQPINSLSYQNDKITDQKYFASITQTKNTVTTDPSEKDVILTDDEFSVTNIAKKHDIEFVKYGREDTENGSEEIVLAGAVFELYKKDASGEYVTTNKTATSDAEGKISFKDLEPGEYELHEMSVPDGYLQIEGQAKSFRINVDGSIEVKDKDGNYVPNDGPANKIVNQKIGKEKFTLTKTDENGKILPGVKFELRDVNDNIVATKTTGEDGKITFENLSPGKYWLKEVEAADGFILNKEPIPIVLGIKPETDWQVPGNPENSKDVSNLFTLDTTDPKVNFIRSTSGSETVVNPNNGEGLKVNARFNINDINPEDINPGDTFTLNLSKSIDIDGITESQSLNLKKFNIIGSSGTLAVATSVGSDRKSINYTFTNYVDKYTVRSLNLSFPAFIDRYEVKNKTNNVPLSINIGNANYSDSINVSYDNYANNTLRTKSLVTKFNRNTGHFTTIVYLNSQKDFNYYREFNFYTDQNIKDVSMEVYTLPNGVALPWSFGVDFSKLNEVNVNTWKDQYKRNSYWADLGDYGSSNTYVIKVQGTTDVKNENTLVTHSIFYRNINGTNYNHSWQAVVNFYSPETGYQGDTSITIANFKNKIEYTKMSGKIEANVPEGLPPENPNEGEQIPPETKDNEENLVPDQVLEGAEFQLQKKEGENWVDYGDVKTSGKDGKFFWEGLPQGEYEVWETKAPDGYKLPTEAVSSFRVDEDGNIVDIKNNNFIIINEKDNMRFYIDKIWESDDNTPNSIEIGTLELELTAPVGQTFPDSVKVETEIPEGRKYKITKITDDKKTITIEIPLKDAYEGITSETDKNKGIKIDVPSDWPDGEYTLVETKAPAGFKKTRESEKGYTIVVNKTDKTIKNGNTILYQKGDSEEKLQALQIVNEKGLFPSTGGMGTLLFTAIGAIVMAVAFVGYRRKRVRE